MPDHSLLHLLHLCDPSLPIGGFSHSAGLETYVQEGFVNNKETLKEFVSNQLTLNLHYTDAAMLSLSYDAVEKNDFDAVSLLDEQCSALKLPKETRLSSNKLGLRLLKIFPVKDQSFAKRYLKSVQQQKADGHYCIAFALLAFELGIKKKDALEGFYFNAATSLITNGVKLIPLGQQDGQQILMELIPAIHQLALDSLKVDQHMIGYCNNGFDIRSMQHEELYSRLYMS